MKEYFRFYNANPYGKITQDCVIRSLTLFLNKTYEDVLNDLINIYKHTGLHIADPVCFMYYLLKQNNIKRYDVDFTKHTTLLDLCKILETQNYSNLKSITINDSNSLLNGNSKKYDNVLVLLKNTHLTFINKNVIIDTWNCSNLKVTTYFLKEE